MVTNANKNKKRPYAIAILGPTASGKTDVAEQLSDQLNAIIINGDTFHMYRDLNVGTAKPTNFEKYRLLNILDINESLTAGKYVSLARPICVEEAQAGRHVLVAGGTGLYIRALFEEYTDMAPPVPQKLRSQITRMTREKGAEATAKYYGLKEMPEDTIINNQARFVRWIERKLTTPNPIETKASPWIAHRLKVGLQIPKGDLEQRIEHRVRKMVQNGWLEEVKGLLQRGANPNCQAFRAIGYKEMVEVLAGTMTMENAIERIVVKTRQYAKRQMTWLRKEPQLLWIAADQSPKKIAENIIRRLKTLEVGE